MARTQATGTPSLAPVVGLLIKLGVVVAIALFVWLRFFHSTVPSAEEVDAAFVPVAGYEYGSSDSAATEAVEGFVRAIPGFEEEIEQFEVKELYSRGRAIGLVMIGSFEYSEDVRAEFDAGATQDGAEPTTLGATGQTFPAFKAQEPPAYGYMWLDEDGYFFTVVTMHPTDAQTVATALGTAAL